MELWRNGHFDGVKRLRLTVSWPTILTNPHFGSAALVLNVLEGLHDVVEELVGCVGDWLALPIAKGIHEAMVNSTSVLCAQHFYSLHAVTHRRSTPPVRSALAVPSAYLFQLSAVPTFV